MGIRSRIPSSVAFIPSIPLREKRPGRQGLRAKTARWRQQHLLSARKIQEKAELAEKALLQNEVTLTLTTRESTLTLSPPVPHIFGFSFFISTLSTTF